MKTDYFQRDVWKNVELDLIPSLMNGANVRINVTVLIVMFICVLRISIKWLMLVDIRGVILSF